VHYTVFYFQVEPMIATIDNYVTHPDFQWFQSFVNSSSFIHDLNIINHYNTVFLPAVNSAATDAQALQATVDFMNWYREAYLSLPTVVGASGAIYGLLLAFGMTFRNALIYIYFLFPMKAKWFVLIFGALELFSGIRNNPADNVAHFAHLGGMLFGLLLILYWKKKDISNDYYQF